MCKSLEFCGQVSFSCGKVSCFSTGYPQEKIEKAEPEKGSAVSGYLRKNPERQRTIVVMVIIIKVMMSVTIQPMWVCMKGRSTF